MSKRVDARLNSFLTQFTPSENWIISEEAIRNTSALLHKLPVRFLRRLRDEKIIPQSDGTVLLLWERADQDYLLVEVGAVETAFLVRTNSIWSCPDSKLLFEVEKIAYAVTELLNLLFPPRRATLGH